MMIIATRNAKRRTIQSMPAVSNIVEHREQRPDLLQAVEGDGELSKLFELRTEIIVPRVELYKRLYKGVGNTSVHSVQLANGGTAHLKLECANALGGSHYARFWIPYLFVAETLGMIKPGETKLLEVTSGSSGIALAMAAEQLGYQLTIITPSILPERRIAPMLAAGAEIISVEGYIAECISRLRRMLTTRAYFAPNHSEEPSNMLIHTLRRITVEYLLDFPTPDYAYAALGNGCSTIGLLRPLLQRVPYYRRSVYWPAEDFDSLVYGMLGQPIDLRHIPEAISLGVSHRIHGALAVVQEIVQKQVDLGNLQPGWSTVLGLSQAIENDRIDGGKQHYLVCYDTIGRY